MASNSAGNHSGAHRVFAGVQLRASLHLPVFHRSFRESGAFFSIVLHLGTLFAVVIAFFPTIWGLIQEAFAMLGDLFRGRFSFRRVTPRRKMIFLLIVSLLPLVFVVFLKDFYEGFSTDDGIIARGSASSSLVSCSPWPAAVPTPAKMPPA